MWPSLVPGLSPLVGCGRHPALRRALRGRERPHRPVPDSRSSPDQDPSLGSRGPAAAPPPPRRPRPKAASARRKHHHPPLDSTRVSKNPNNRKAEKRFQPTARRAATFFPIRKCRRGGNGSSRASLPAPPRRHAAMATRPPPRLDAGVVALGFRSGVVWEGSEGGVDSDPKTERGDRSPRLAS